MWQIILIIVVVVILLALIIYFLIAGSNNNNNGNGNNSSTQNANTSEDPADDLVDIERNSVEKTALLRLYMVEKHKGVLPDDILNLIRTRNKADSTIISSWVNNDTGDKYIIISDEKLKIYSRMLEEIRNDKLNNSVLTDLRNNNNKMATLFLDSKVLSSSTSSELETLLNDYDNSLVKEATNLIQAKYAESIENYNESQNVARNISVIMTNGLWNKYRNKSAA